jgi:hypothetical protein
MGESHSLINIRQGIVNHSIQVAQKNSPKVNHPMKKWVNELNKVFSKEEVQMAKITY